MEYNSIGLILTDNCNAACRMCCDSCGEVKGYTLTLDDLDLVLSQIKDCKFIDYIGITGGEPMLYPDLCEYILNYNFERKVTVGIKTNGFWGNNLEKAQSFLEKNWKNLSNVSFSYDEFHKEFIDIQYIKNIIDICLELKIRTEIVGCFLAKGMQPGDILNELGSYVYRTEYVYQPVIATGSAKKLKNAKFIKLLDTDKDTIICPVASVQHSTLLINSKRELYPCCSQCVENTILKVGSLNESPLKEIINDITHNKLMHTVFTKGFTPFIDFMKKNNISYPKKLSSHCEMCEYLFSSEWFMMELTNKHYYDNI